MDLLSWCQSFKCKDYFPADIFFLEMRDINLVSGKFAQRCQAFNFTNLDRERIEEIYTLIQSNTQIRNRRAQDAQSLTSSRGSIGRSRARNHSETGGMFHFPGAADTPMAPSSDYTDSTPEELHHRPQSISRPSSAGGIAASTQASTTGAGDIYDAIREGRHEDVQALVDANLDIFSRNEHGHAALSEAIHKADVESCRILLSGRAGPETKCNSPACRQARPVHIAAMVNNVPILELLVSKGANISSLSENNENALHWAARHDSTEAMKYLISLHLAKDSKDSHGETPLHHAVRSRCPGSVTYLLSLQRDAAYGAREARGRSRIRSWERRAAAGAAYGAREARDGSRRRSRSRSDSREHRKSRSRKHKKESRSRSRSDSRSKLKTLGGLGLVAAGIAAAAAYAQKKNNDKNDAEERGRSRSWEWSAVASVAYGAREARDRSRSRSRRGLSTSLSPEPNERRAAAGAPYGAAYVTRKVRDRNRSRSRRGLSTSSSPEPNERRRRRHPTGAPPPYDDLLNKSEETPLDLAITGGWLLGVELLISDSISDPTQRCNLQAAFHRVTLLASYEIFDALISSGVDIHAPDQFGRQPLHEAARSKTDSSRKIRHLLDYGANIEAQCLLEISTPLVPAEEYVKAIPANRAPVRPNQRSQGNLPFKHDTTPLLFAASFGTFASVQSLIQAGANCAARNVRGDMVHNSLYNPDAAVLKLLLEDSTRRGANVTVATACMKAVITAPAASRIQISSAHINILLDGGARMHDNGSGERSLLYIATLARNTEIVRLTLARPLDEMAVKNAKRVYSDLRNFLLQNKDILALFNHRDVKRRVADRNQILKEKDEKVKKERKEKAKKVKKEGAIVTILGLARARTPNPTRRSPG